MRAVKGSETGGRPQTKIGGSEKERGRLGEREEGERAGAEEGRGREGEGREASLKWGCRTRT